MSPKGALGFMPQPPNYQETVAAHDLFCYLCLNYKDERCEKYQVPVIHHYTCDSWERNWDASEHP
jgi:hypothetical protein